MRYVCATKCCVTYVSVSPRTDCVVCAQSALEALATVDQIVSLDYDGQVTRDTVLEILQERLAMPTDCKISDNDGPMVVLMTRPEPEAITQALILRERVAQQRELANDAHEQVLVCLIVCCAPTVYYCKICLRRHVLCLRRHVLCLCRHVLIAFPYIPAMCAGGRGARAVAGDADTAQEEGREAQ